MMYSANMSTTEMQIYLKATAIIDYQHPTIQQLAQKLTSGDDKTTAQACFEWVRDRIRHSSDYQMNPVTCRASEVLAYKTGYCFAKSHLLAALLRANSIPIGCRLPIPGMKRCITYPMWKRKIT